MTGPGVMDRNPFWWRELTSGAKSVSGSGQKEVSRRAMMFRKGYTIYNGKVSAPKRKL
jgi:hypothetical protein